MPNKSKNDCRLCTTFLTIKHVFSKRKPTNKNTIQLKIQSVKHPTQLVTTKEIHDRNCKFWTSTLNCKMFECKLWFCRTVGDMNSSDCTWVEKTRWQVALWAMKCLAVRRATVCRWKNPQPWLGVMLSQHWPLTWNRFLCFKLKQSGAKRKKWHKTWWFAHINPHYKSNNLKPRGWYES